MNKVFLMGRLTRDPDIRQTTSGTMVANYTLAVDRQYAKKDASGKKPADFITIVAWDKRAEFAQKYLQKGRQIVVLGRIETRNYDDKDGKKVYVTEIIAEETYFADSKMGAALAKATGGGEISQDGGDGFYELPADDELPF